eukprot:jgi/Mesen1/7597/ME000395S06755
MRLVQNSGYAAKALSWLLVILLFSIIYAARARGDLPQLDAHDNHVKGGGSSGGEDGCPCGGRADGFYADMTAVPRCIAYCKCRGGEAVGRGRCEEGSLYSSVLQSCGPPRMSACHAGVGDRGSQRRQALASKYWSRTLELARSGGGRSSRRRKLLQADAGSPDGDASVLRQWVPQIVDPQALLQNWSRAENTLDACSWYGVTCNPLKRVVSLDLSNSGLGGPVAPELRQLSQLRTLNFSSNAFSGSLAWAAGLTQLILLDVSNNSFTGSRAWLAGLRALVYLDVNRCMHLDASDVGFVRHLSRLEYFNALGSNLEGDANAALAPLSSFHLVDLSFNRLRGNFTWLDNKASLVYLALDDGYDAAGASLEGLFSSRNLDYLSLRHVNAGGFLWWLRDLSGLDNLDISYNRFDLRALPLSGAVPSHTALRMLFIEGPGYSGSLSWVGQMQRLTILRLGNSSFDGSDLTATWLANLSQLAVVQLPGDAFAPATPPVGVNLTAFQHMRSLAALTLTGANISGRIPPQFGLMENLTSLELKGNSLEGPVPEELASCRKLRTLALAGNRLTGGVPGALARLPGLQALDLSGNKLSGSLPVWNSSELQSLELSGNGFAGPFPGLVAPNLLTLNLSSNKLYGSVPALSSLPNLQTFDISNNQLTGSVPHFSSQALLSNQTGLFKYNASSNYFSGAPLATLGNLTARQVAAAQAGNCLSAAGTSQTLALSFPQKSRAQCAAFCGVGVNAAPCGGKGSCRLDELADLAPTCACNAGYITGAVPTSCAVAPPPPPSPSASPPAASNGGSSSDAEDCDDDDGTQLDQGFLDELCTQMVKRTRLREVEAATDKFSPERLLGEGGYGAVYLGKAAGGQMWAVKRASRASQESLGVFQNEVKLIAKINHRNLVTLLGYCCERGEQLLLYEYVPNGTLLDHLRLNPKYRTEPMTFEERVGIAVGAARGLHYLHSFAKDPIVHRDVKSGNILIDANMQAKVCDFGLSKILPGGAKDEHLTTRIAGTPGYLDPDYYNTFQVTAKSDVYSFGVVLLELLTGRPPVMEISSNTVRTWEPIALERWARMYMVTGEILEMLDPAIKSEVSMAKVKLLTAVASACLLPAARDRPHMSQVSRYLDMIESAEGDDVLTGVSVDHPLRLGEPLPLLATELASRSESQVEASSELHPGGAPGGTGAGTGAGTGTGIGASAGAGAGGAAGVSFYQTSRENSFSNGSDPQAPISKVFSGR